MRLNRSAADVHIPGGGSLGDALARTTHLCIAAHADDIEIMAYHGIAECRSMPGASFTGVVVTDGAGSPRAGAFAGHTDEQMRAIRRDEQRRAAEIGGYGAILQLAHPSAAVKEAGNAEVQSDLRVIVSAVRPRVVYLHNPADKHDTHVAVFRRCIEAFRCLPKDHRPPRVLGCEVWRDLDWLPDASKQVLDVSADPELATRLVAVFQSQISAGKHYDLAVAGRRLANATFHTSHDTDRATALTWAMDLTPLVADDSLDIAEYVLGFVDRFREDVAGRLAAFAARSNEHVRRNALS